MRLSAAGTRLPGMYGLLFALRSRYRRAVEGGSEHSDCIDPDELVAMMEGNLPPDRGDLVLAHVDACGSCAEVVAKLGSIDGDDSGRVGRYELEGVLGAGAMGIVHRGWDPELRRHVAIKLVRPERASEAARARTLREARSLARIQHPNVIAVHDVGEHAGQIYLATEFVDGETLEAWVQGKSADEILDAWIQVARGLAAAHAGGVLHRDVKPTNVLVGRDGRVRIGDFGLARTDPASQSGGERAASDADVVETDRPDGVAALGTVGSQLTAPGALAGTPAYMAPEQWRGGFDARSDVYAVCVGLVEGLEGARPKSGAAITLEGVGTLGGVERRTAIAAVLTRGLSVGPEARPQTMTALADALCVARAIGPKPRHTRLWIAAALGAAGIGLVAGGLALRANTGPACKLEVADDVLTPERKTKLGPLARPIEHWVTTWNAAVVETCASTELRERRVDCMQGSLDTMRALLARWDAKVPEAMVAFDALEMVPHPTRCSVAAVRAQLAPTLEQMVAMIPLRERFRQQPSRAIVEQVKALEFSPYTVEILLALASATPPEKPEVLAILREALAEARSDYDTGAATYRLISRLGTDPDNEGPRLAEAVRPRLIAIGDAFAESGIDFALGSIAMAKGRWEEAGGHFERARRGFRINYGPDSIQEGVVLLQIGLASFRRDPLDPRGEEMFTKGIELWERFGMPPPPNPFQSNPATRLRYVENAVARHTRSNNKRDLAEAYYFGGSAYRLASQPEKAREYYRRAVELWDELGRSDSSPIGAREAIASLSVELGHPAEALPYATEAAARAKVLNVEMVTGDTSTTMGEILLANGDAAEARVWLEKAVVIRDRETAGSRGFTRYLLAEALWNHDRKRALVVLGSAEQDTHTALQELDRNPGYTDAGYLRKKYELRLEKIEKLKRKR